MKSLSIITINYNNKEGLEKTINSIRNQSSSQFQYIIVDGGSTDGSIEIIKQNYDIIDIWISEKDHGIYEAMNKGVKLSSGEFLQFLNSGDWLNSSDVIETILPHLKDNIDILSGYSVRRSSEGEYNREISGSPEYLTVSSIFKSPLSHTSSFIRRSILVNRPYDENYRIVSDWKFFMEASIFDNIRYQHIDFDISVFDSSGISSSSSQLHNEERAKVLKEILPEYLNRDLTSIPPEIYRLMRQIPSAYRLHKIIIWVVSKIISTYKCLMPTRLENRDLPVINIDNSPSDRTIFHP